MDAIPPAAPPPIPARLTFDELQRLSGADAETIQRLIGAGTLTRGDGDQPFVAGDVYRIKLVLACEAAGMHAEAIGKAIEAGDLSLGFLDLPHYRWGGLTSTTYRQLAEEVELPVELVLEIAQAMGSIGRSADDRVRQDELETAPLMRFAATVLDHESLVRTTRVYAQAMRRITDAESGLWERFVVGGFLRMGLPYPKAIEMANAFGADATAMQERLLLTAYRRSQERQWTEVTVDGIESVLEQMGTYRRPERPNAFTFLDLAGYTALTEEHGDHASARIATELGGMVDSIAAGWRGRPIKWLGDGVMVHFRDPSDAVGATLAMVERAPEVGLPAHAGIAAGPVVLQDGDYFGRTVNLAARIASAAGAGRTFVDDEVVRTAAGGSVAFEEVGALELKGFSRPVRIYEARVGGWPGDVRQERV
jgi:adenylate cyclase